MKRSSGVSFCLVIVAFVIFLPGASGQSRPGVPLALTDPGPVGAATTTAVFSHFAIGGGYTTIFTLLNTGGTALDGDLILTGQNGAPYTANLQSSDGTSATGSSIHVLIPEAGATFVTAAPVSGTAPTEAGWGRVESTGGTIGGVSTFELAQGGALQTVAGVLDSGPVSSATIPVDDNVSQNRFTGFAVANPSSGTITIKVEEVNGNGTVAATLTPITLGSGEQTAKFFFQDSAAIHTFRGSAVLIGEGGATFTVVALVEVHGTTGPLFTAIPVIPGKAPNIN